MEIQISLGEWLLYVLLILDVGFFILLCTKLYLYSWTRCVQDIRIFFHSLHRRVMKKWWREAALAGISFDTVSGESSGGGCAICLREYVDGERRATISHCGHRFHGVCIETWMNEKYNCPICRHDLV